MVGEADGVAVDGAVVGAADGVAVDGDVGGAGLAVTRQDRPSEGGGDGFEEEIVSDGALELGGRLPTNTHGGQLSAGRLHGYGFLHEACVHLWGEGGARQVGGDPRVGVAAAGGGPLGGCMLLARD